MPKTKVILLKICCFLVSCFSLFLIANFVSAEEVPDDFKIKKLKYSPNAPELYNNYVNPNWGNVCQRFAYTVTYSDKRGLAPKYVKLYLRLGSKPKGKMYNMQKLDKNQNNYKQGVTYVYYYTPNDYGDHFYFFQASNGLAKARAGIIDSPSNGPVLFKSSFKNNEIALIDIKKGTKIWSYNTGKEWVGGVALSDDGKYLAAKTNNYIYLFETNSSKPKWTFYQDSLTRIGDDMKGGVAISSDGSKIFASLGNYAMLFSKDSNEPIWKYHIPTQAYNVAISADGNYAAAGTIGESDVANQNLLLFWKTSNSNPLWKHHSSGNFHDVSLSKNGDFIAGSTGCPDRRFYLFSKNSSKPVFRTKMLTEDAPVHRAKISLKGTKMVASSDDGAMFFFKNKSKKAVWKFLAPHSSSFRALSLSSNGKYIGGATFNGRAYIFNSLSNEPLAKWRINASFGSAGVTNNGKYLVAGSTDKKVHIFKKGVAKGKKIRLNEYIEDIAVAKNGKYAVAGTGGYEYFYLTIIPRDKKTYTCN